MPVCCGGCCYVDCIPDCCDTGCCGKMWAVCCCKVHESTNFAMNDPDRCCLGFCKKPCNCDFFENFRYKFCMCKCCGGNCIVDPCAVCCGEWKGNLQLAEKKYNQQVAAKGAPQEEEMVR